MLIASSSRPSMDMPRALLPWRRHAGKHGQAHGYDLKLEYAGAQTAPHADPAAPSMFECVILGEPAARSASVRVHRPLAVCCMAGTVWLTCDGDERDFVMEAGTCHVALPGDFLVLVGLPSASVTISSLPEALPETKARWLHHDAPETAMSQPWHTPSPHAVVDWLRGGNAMPLTASRS